MQVAVFGRLPNWFRGVFLGCCLSLCSSMALADEYSRQNSPNGFESLVQYDSEAKACIRSKLSEKEYRQLIDGVRRSLIQTARMCENEPYDATEYFRENVAQLHRKDDEAAAFYACIQELKDKQIKLFETSSSPLNKMVSGIIEKDVDGGDKDLPINICGDVGSDFEAYHVYDNVKL